MSKYTAFMAGAVDKIENKKVVVSNRFKDEKGKPIPFEIKALSADENDELQRRCMVNVPVPGQRGQYTRELDQIKYTAMLLTESVVYPDLNEAELQDSYGVRGAESLLRKMLYTGEYNKLAQEVMALSNIEVLSDLVEEAKN
ncbi:MAG: hypothetical protein IKW41_06965 [Phascolarctobacterium sp.]|nr:hypothetical protein [Phascolarctobacterium sp.]